LSIASAAACVGVWADTNPAATWLSNEQTLAAQLMLNNVSAPGESPGSVIAAPSQTPDYYYHWTRDAGITMDVVVDLYENAMLTGQTADATNYLQILSDYTNFSRGTQLTTNLSGGPDGLGLGEPKFNLNGTPFVGSWGRPQNDGAAIRAASLTRLAQDLISGGIATNLQWVRQKLYDGQSPSQSVIKVDLDFLAQHWQDPSYDLWEEVEGTHFFTQMVQRKALVVGAALADRLGDSASAATYRAAASGMGASIQNFWNASSGQIVATLNWVAGLTGKNSGLDSAVILGVLRGDAGDGFFGVTDDRVWATAEKMRLVFQDLYPINQTTLDWQGQPMGTAIGRYPEDTYSGGPTRSGGNPWFLATSAFAEFYYKAATSWQASGKIAITSLNASILQGLRGYSGSSLVPGETLTSSDVRFASVLQAIRNSGDDMMRRVHYHADSSGSLSEQIDRNTGFMESAANLTWSYAGFLSAFKASQ
jgi:glucoamylase